MQLSRAGLRTVKEPPLVALLHGMVGNRQRGTIIAIFVWINSAIGLVFGPLFVGAISDALQPGHGTASLTYAIAALAPFSLCTAAAFYAASVALQKADRHAASGNS
jgi:MFS family permease